MGRKQWKTNNSDLAALSGSQCRAEKNLRVKDVDSLDSLLATVTEQFNKDTNFPICNNGAVSSDGQYYGGGTAKAACVHWYEDRTAWKGAQWLSESKLAPKWLDEADIYQQDGSEKTVLRHWLEKARASYEDPRDHTVLEVRMDGG